MNRINTAPETNGTRRLKVLRQLDAYHNWHSLEDELHCVLCEQTFKGHDVRVIRNRSGGRRLACPAQGCGGTPAEWVRPGNPLVSEEAWLDWVRLLGTLHDAGRSKRVMRRFQPRADGSGGGSTAVLKNGLAAGGSGRLR